MRLGTTQSLAAATLAFLISFQAWADQEAPDPWEGQLFDTTATCSAAANHQDRWRSPRIDELIAKRGSAISGRIQLLKPMPKAEYTSNVGLVARGVDKRHFSELGFYTCNNSRSVCAQASHVSWEDERRVEKVPVSGIFDVKAKIPLHIQFNGPRQWIVGYGGKSVTLNFPYDVDTLQIRCVSGRGWASFDPPKELTS
jgi:hypothetical protein